MPIFEYKYIIIPSVKSLLSQAKAAQRSVGLLLYALNTLPPTV